MSTTPVVGFQAEESAVVASARRAAAGSLLELEQAWRNPQPDAVVVAARRHLAGAENWADARREGA
ncbi:hypothetical protein [Arthrobacter crystallopoietes]|uniref:hypothetical protein n=1 Tax=Crystallibacter crystallopoietes TaxID=37928 RepID=UPI001113D86C|nr:hypothetical protein [Arthrobacter crystallopoietes]